MYLAMVAVAFPSLLGGASSSSGISNPPPEPVPPSYFSMNILFHPQNRVPWPAVPMGGWRTWHVNWADIQSAPDKWDFSVLDKFVGWSQQHNTEILMHLSYTPRWASSTPDAFSDADVYKTPGLNGPPRNMKDWQTYVRTIATRYKGKIHNWEIWNEPNRPQSWNGTVDAMVEMEREAYTILKQVDPACIVVSPAPEQQKGLPFLDAFLAKGGGKYADVIGYHFYVGANAPPEAMVDLIGSVKSIMAKHGASSKPLWNTEAGWLGDDMLPPETGAAWLARAYVLNWASGVSRFYWYAWENHRGTRIELVGKDNAALTPAGKAFVTIQNWMTGAVLTGCTTARSSLWTCDLQRAGRASHIVWNASGSATLNIPSTWQASEVDTLDGGKTSIQGSSIPADIAPVLVQ